MRLGVLCPARLSAFQQSVMRPLLESEQVEVVAACIDARRPPRRASKLWRQLRRGRGGYAAVMGLRSLRPRGAGDAVAADALFSAHGIPTRAVEDLYAAGTLAFLGEARPDLLLRTGFGIVREPVLSLAPLGTISYHHGDLRRYRGQPAAFWELYHGERAMGVTVQLLSEELDAGAIVCERRVAIYPDDTWRTLRERAHRQSADMAHEACLRLSDPDFEPVALAAGELGPLYTAPNGRQWLGLELRVARRRAGAAA
jgi:folate-dependent phosphoribosylglycinamide formyltransferase PurN